MRRVMLVLSVVLLLALPLLASAQAGTYYVVQYGDTLARIAARFGTTTQVLATTNGIFNVNHIYAGQVLVIPTVTVPPPPPIVPPPITPGTTLYLVRPGDTVGNIARAFNTTVFAIATANRLPNPSLIYPGQQLVIPPPQPITVVRYVVQPGDELRFIAARFNTTWRVIATYNGIANANRIFPGQVLLIPQ